MAKAKHRSIPDLTPEQIQRFWSHVDQSSGPDSCWPWTGTMEPKKPSEPAAYGRFTIRRLGHKRFLLKAHRVAFKVIMGVDPGEFLVCHSCDFPPCQNGAHLFLGTNDENMADMAKKGRAASGDRNGTKLYPERLARGTANGKYTCPESTPRCEKHGMAKLTWPIVNEIRRRFGTGDRKLWLAREFHVTPQQINKIVTGEHWKSTSSS